MSGMNYSEKSEITNSATVASDEFVTDNINAINSELHSLNIDLTTVNIFDSSSGAQITGLKTGFSS